MAPTRKKQRASASTPYPSPGASTSTATRTAKPKKVPRPANAWILYRTSRLKILRAMPRDPNAPPMTQSDISKTIGLWWQNESPEVRRQFEKAAEIVKAKHAEENPDYKYQPQSKEEKARAREEAKAEKKREKEAEKQAKASKSPSPRTASSSRSVSDARAQSAPTPGASRAAGLQQDQRRSVPRSLPRGGGPSPPFSDPNTSPDSTPSLQSAGDSFEEPTAPSGHIYMQGAPGPSSSSPRDSPPSYSEGEFGPAAGPDVVRQWAAGTLLREDNEAHPLPVDLPFVTDFGAADVADVFDALASGIMWVPAVDSRPGIDFDLDGADAVTASLGPSSIPDVGNEEDGLGPVLDMNEFAEVVEDTAASLPELHPRTYASLMNNTEVFPYEEVRGFEEHFPEDAQTIMDRGEFYRAQGAEAAFLYPHLAPEHPMTPPYAIDPVNLREQPEFRTPEPPVDPEFGEFLQAAALRDLREFYTPIDPNAVPSQSQGAGPSHQAPPPAPQPTDNFWPQEPFDANFDHQLQQALGSQVFEQSQVFEHSQVFEQSRVFEQPQAFERPQASDEPQSHLGLFPPLSMPLTPFDMTPPHAATPANTPTFPQAPEQLQNAPAPGPSRYIPPDLSQRRRVGGQYAPPPHLLQSFQSQASGSGSGSGSGSSSST